MKLSIELTDKCSHGCKNCYKDARASNSQFIDAGQLITFAKECVKAFHAVFALGGGEPFEHPEIDFIIRELEQNNIPYSITSGSADRAIEYRDRIKNGSVWLSVHEPEEFPHILSAISKFSNGGINIQLKKSVLPYVREFATKIPEQIPFIYSVFKRAGRMAGDESISKEELREVVKTTWLITHRPVGISSCEKIVPQEKCPCGITWVTITPELILKPNSFEKYGIRMMRFTMEEFTHAYRLLPKGIHEEHNLR